MPRAATKVVPTHYQILQVHPAAPLDLITAAYWRLVSLAHSAGNSGKASEIAVYHLTRSYQVLASPISRAEYDQSLGISTLPLRPDAPRKRSPYWLPVPRQDRAEDRPFGDASLDYYSFLRLDPLANQAIIAESYNVMRNHYLRLVE